MLTTQTLQNAMKFMERANSQGLEAFAWCQTYVALQNELNTPQPQPQTNIPVGPIANPTVDLEAKSVSEEKKSE